MTPTYDKVNGKEVVFKIDKGAEVTAISMDHWPSQITTPSKIPVALISNCWMYLGTSQCTWYTVYYTKFMLLNH